MSRYDFTVSEEEERTYRLDSFLVLKFAEHSRSYLQKLIKNSCVLVNGSAAKQKKTLRAFDKVSVTIPDPVPLEVIAENIPLDIVYEDKDIIVINKSPGVIVHPVTHQLTGTLVNALLFHLKELSAIGGVLRPGIVHRLDKDTSGLIMVAKNDMAHRSLAEQLKTRSMIKRYTALLVGAPKGGDVGKIDFPVGRHPVDRKKMAAFRDTEPRHAKTALTRYCVTERFKGFTLVTPTLHTGRTHQIRVHFASIGCPVFGDAVYGRRNNITLSNGVVLKAGRQCLHASYLELTHPRTGNKLSLTAPLPEDIKKNIDTLRSLSI